MVLTALSGAVACNGTAKGTEEAVCRYEEGSQPAPATLTQADIYLDASESMQGYISAPGFSIPITPLQQLLQTLLVEKLNDAGVVPRLHTFGLEVNPPLPLRALGDYVRERMKYSEGRSDVVAALEEAAKNSSSLSVIVTDNAQDLQFAKEGKETRAPGFDRSAIARAVSEDLAGKGFGVWLVGAQSPFEGTYFSLLLTLKTSGAGTNKRVELTGGKERPFYCWIVSRDWEKGRKLVAALQEELVKFTGAGAGRPKIQALEFFPGVVPALTIEEPDEGELLAPASDAPQASHPTLVDRFRVKRWTTDTASPQVTSAELTFEQPRTSELRFLLKVRLARQSDREETLYGLPVGVWEIIPKEPLDLGARLTREIRHFTVEGPPESAPDTSLKYWELALPYDRLVSQPEERWTLAIPLSIRMGPVPGNHWLREWSTDDDTTPEGISGRTLYLYDVSKSILERTAGRQRGHGCLALKFTRQ